MSKPLTEDSGWEVARIWQNRALAAEATADRYKVALERIAGKPGRCGPYKCEGLGNKFEPYDCVRCIATAALTGTEPGERT